MWEIGFLTSNNVLIFSYIRFVQIYNLIIEESIMKYETMLYNFLFNQSKAKYILLHHYIFIHKKYYDSLYIVDNKNLDMIVCDYLKAHILSENWATNNIKGIHQNV